MDTQDTHGIKGARSAQCTEGAECVEKEKNRANEILEILAEDSRIPPERIAAMLNCPAAEVERTIRALLDENVISFKPIINWEKAGREVINAHIELKITPQRDMGFEKVAKRIYKYPQVKSLHLMSGGYDLALDVEGRTMKEVALFVAEKLAPMEGVVSTATHFVLRTYKENGFVFDDKERDGRQVITL
ncbi:MAG: Lrp/AsnC family transcriptional regulator [Clostridiales bacterium]|jgi:DNA-binding Lrp family transcriptional regulator|nr:Lrp/AsnC family transcriptional regulator [Clostridiales bacterium]